MKKWLTFLLAAALALTASACSCENQNAPLAGTMEENVTKIMADNPAEFMGGLIPLDLQDTSEDGLWALKNYTGLTSPQQLTDVAVYEPMTGAQAFSLVLVRVADKGEAKAVAQQMKAGIDPRKWICAGADQVMAAGYNDTVMFIMVDSQLGKTAQSYVDAFAKLCGGRVDFTI